MSSEKEVADGKYAVAKINFENAFLLKAYAYLDTDNNGTIDTTIWTTATGIQISNSKMLPEQMTSKDYYRYPFANAINVEESHGQQCFTIWSCYFL